jgi:hypothetical protein
MSKNFLPYLRRVLLGSTAGAVAVLMSVAPSSAQIGDPKASPQSNPSGHIGAAPDEKSRDNNDSARDTDTRSTTRSAGGSADDNTAMEDSEAASGREVTNRRGKQSGTSSRGEGGSSRGVRREVNRLGTDREETANETSARRSGTSASDSSSSSTNRISTGRDTSGSEARDQDAEDASGTGATRSGRNAASGEEEGSSEASARSSERRSSQRETSTSEDSDSNATESDTAGSATAEQSTRDRASAAQRSSSAARRNSSASRDTARAATDGSESGESTDATTDRDRAEQTRSSSEANRRERDRSQSTEQAEDRDYDSDRRYSAREQERNREFGDRQEDSARSEYSRNEYDRGEYDRAEFQDDVRDTARAVRDTVRGARDAFRDARSGVRDSDFRDRDYADREYSDRDYSDRSRSGDTGSYRDARVSSRSDFDVSTVRGPDLGLWFGRATNDGLVISDVASSGVISRVGFREGDQIVSVNGTRVASERDFVRYLFDDDIRDQRVAVVVYRNGAQQTLYVEPSVLVEQYTTVQHDPLEQFGVLVDDRYYDRVVVLRVIPRTPAYYAGLRPGDVISTWGDTRISRPDEFVQAVQHTETGLVPVQVYRGRQLRRLEAELPQFEARAERRTSYRPDFDAAAPAVDVERASERREQRIEQRREQRLDNSGTAIEVPMQGGVNVGPAGANVEVEARPRGVLRPGILPRAGGLLPGR